MDNPMKDIAEKRKEQIMYNRLDTLEKSVDTLRRNTMKLVEIEVFQRHATGGSEIHTVSISPEYIVFIEDSGEHSYIHMSDGTTLHAIASQQKLLSLFRGDTDKSYIK